MTSVVSTSPSCSAIRLPLRRSSRLVLASFATACLGSCNGDPTQPAFDELNPPVPQYEIRDGAHNAGNPHVFFLPPLVSNPAPNGTFDPTVTPKIEVCPSDLSGCTGPAIATMVFGVTDENVRLDQENELYVANWHTPESGVQAGSYYRIRVLQGSSILAIADVLITEGGKGLNAETGEYFELKDGRTLPIKVRIEEGAANSAPAEAGSGDGAAAVAVPAGAVDEYVELTVTPVDESNPPEPLPEPSSGTALPGTIYSFEPTGQEFSQPVEITLAIPPSLPDGVDPLGLRVYYAGPNGWEETPGTVDLAEGVVTGLTTHFSSFAILPSQVTACDDPMAPPGFATMEGALAAVGPGGTITVCDGTHPVDSVSVGKPVTIEGEGGGANPVVQTTTARAGFFVEDVDSGTVTFRNLAFDNATAHPPNNYSIYLRTTYDQVVIENAVFTVQGGNTGSVVATGSSVPGAHVSVQNSSFSGGVIGINMSNAAVDITTSTFQNHSTFGLWYQNSTGQLDGSTLGPNCGGANCVRVQGASADVTVLGNDFTETRTGLAATHRVVFVLGGGTGRIEDNDFFGCGGGQCVFGFGGAGLEVVNNRLAIDGTHETGMAIDGQGAGTTLLVTDNTITGVGVGSSGYGTLHCAIEVEDGAVLTAHRNTLTNVHIGICGFNGGVVADAQDNLVDNAEFGVGVYGGSQVTANFNDFTNMVNAGIDLPDSDPALSDLTCNWWGSATGPLNPGTLPTTLFTPWALAPVANTGASGCSGS